MTIAGATALPSIHPMLGLGVFPAVNHQPEMTAHYRADRTYRIIIEGGKIMALTAIELALNAMLKLGSG
jgi:hypothetical protein